MRRKSWCASVAALNGLAVSAAVLPQPEAPFRGKIAPNVVDSIPYLPPPIAAPKGAPNIIVVLLDDVGFGAAGTFGGPVQTPELDRLAAQGLRYNNFTVSAQCSPTRAALLTGRNDHRSGYGTVSFGGYPGYNNVIPKRTALFADVLRRNGYSTAAVGKWHNTPSWEITPVGPFDRWPTGLGFDYFYGIMGALDSQWEPAPYRNTIAVEAPAKPADGYHLTTDLTDEAIRWIQTHESLAPEKPYFLYFATCATHEPHHVGSPWIEKYRGQFDQGWDRLRQQIFERQKRLGVIPADADLTPRPSEMPAWDSYSADERRIFSRQMEVYAGYLEQTDYEVGRLLREVREGPGGDNTLVMYIIGDNGASAEGGLTGVADFHTRKSTPETVPDRLRHLDELGGPGHFDHYAVGWAWALCAPFKWEKMIASHFGGTRNPMVVSWPARIADRGGLRPQFTHVTDIAATIFDVTGIEFPSRVDGVDQVPLDGVSFAPTFAGAAVPAPHRLQVFEQWGNRAIYQDGWIAAARHLVPWTFEAHRNDHTYEQDRWELYHVTADFSEAHDLADRYPEKLKEMEALFDAEARQNDIYPLGGSTKGADIPRFAAGKPVLVYRPSVPRLPATAAPRFDGSHRITADAVIPPSGAAGVILSEGTRSGGFVLYVKGGRLIYENNTTTARDVIVSDVAIPSGPIELAYEFHRETTPVSGTGRLYINGKLVGEAKLARVAWDVMGGYNMPGSFGIGQAYGSPVSPAFELPFRFTGTLRRVRVELK